jgi:hypothetical protein
MAREFRDEILKLLPNPVVGPCYKCQTEFDLEVEVGFVCTCSTAYFYSCWQDGSTTLCAKCSSPRSNVKVKIAKKRHATATEVFILKARKSIWNLATGK